MFEPLLGKVEKNISTMSAIIATNDCLRKTFFRYKSNQDNSNSLPSELISVVESISQDKEWRVYDHCSVVTQLYAVYERFVEDLLSYWLALLPELVPIYSDLEEKIRMTHRIGVARLLNDLNNARCQHLNDEIIIRGLFHGITGENQYDLISEAFVLNHPNLRKDKLEELFCNAGINNSWEWVKKHERVKTFMEDVRGGQNTAEGELNQFISFRNDAAHGNQIEEILSPDSLAEICEFIAVICESLADLVRYKILEEKSQKKQVKSGKILKIGKIINWYEQQGAGRLLVEIPDNETEPLSIGDEVILTNPRISYCKKAKITSLMAEDGLYEQVSLTSGSQLGVKFDLLARRNLSLYLEK